MKRAAESGRNMVASPHVKTSRRWGPRAALILLDKAADIFDKTLAHAAAQKFDEHNFCWDGELILDIWNNYNNY